MPKIRVNRNKGYTVMSNHHLKDKSLSLKSKGLLSMMLSLPDEWHYSTKGLAAICKEGVDAVSSAIKELEKAATSFAIKFETNVEESPKPSISFMKNHKIKRNPNLHPNRKKQNL